MDSVKVIKGKYSQYSIIEILFIFWLVTLPFGAKLLPISIGFMTIYPNLIITLLLLIVGLNGIRQWHIAMKLFVGFLFLWVCYTFGWILIVEKTEMGVFHLRTLIMQLMFAIILFNSMAKIGSKRFYEFFVLGIRLYLYLLFVVGTFEFFTGIHKMGNTPLKWLELNVFNGFYSPLYLFDNQNDFVCYVLFLLGILIVLEKKLRANKFEIAFYTTIILLFASYADSRFGFIVTSSVFIFIAIIEFRSSDFRKLNWKFYALGAIFLAMVISRSEFFYGPKYVPHITFAKNKEVYVYNEKGYYESKRLIDVLSTEEIEDIFYRQDSLNRAENNLASTQFRKHLIYNGLEYIKERPLTGIGPGNYVNRHREGNNTYPTKSLTSPHNFVIEIISQYGVIGWTYFVFLGATCIYFIRRKLQDKKSVTNWIFLFYAMLPILWMIPSSYLYLDIHWLTLPILLCLVKYSGPITDQLAIETTEG